MQRHASCCRQLLLCLVFFFLSSTFRSKQDWRHFIDLQTNLYLVNKCVQIIEITIEPLVSLQKQGVLSFPNSESLKRQRRETRVSRGVASPFHIIRLTSMIKFVYYNTPYLIKNNKSKQCMQVFNSEWMLLRFTLTFEIAYLSSLCSML